MTNKHISKRYLSCLVLSIVLFMSISAYAAKLPDPSKVPFEDGMAQLNTPEIVNKWLRKYWRFDFEKTKKLHEDHVNSLKSGGPGVDVMDFVMAPRETYLKHNGICVDVANFAVYCLKRAGYEKVHVLSAKFKRPSRRSGITVHSACAYKEDGSWYIIANACKTKELRIDHWINGPFKSLDDAGKELVFGNGLDHTFLDWTKDFD